MSLFTFIAATSALPMVNNTNEIWLTVKQAKEENLPIPKACTLESWNELDEDLELIYFKNDDETKFIVSKTYYECELYTQKQFVYELVCSEERIPELINYLKENKREEIELWFIWLSDINNDKNTKYKTIAFSDLNELGLTKAIEEATKFVCTPKEYKFNINGKYYYDCEGQSYCIYIKDF